MKNKYQSLKRTFLIFISLFLFYSSYSQQSCELPQQVTFEGFYGVNLPELNSGWIEARGLPTSVTISESGWYASGVLYSSMDASVSLVGTNNHNWIISPVFTAKANTVLKFKAGISLLHKEPMFSSLGGDDKFAIMVSGEQDGSFESLMEFTIRSENQLTLDLKEYEVDLSQFDGKNIKIGFYATDGNLQDGMCAVHLDDIVLENKEEIDPLIVSIVNPEKKSVAGNTKSFDVIIKNNGSKAISNIPVRGNIRGTINDNFFATYNKTLEPGQTDILSLGSFNYTEAGDYKIQAIVDYEQDQVNYNNEIQSELNFTGLQENPLPVLNFSDILIQISKDGWEEARGEKEFFIYPFDSDWSISDHNYEVCAKVYFTEIYTHDWLISPNIHVTENTKIAFDFALKYMDDVTSMGSDDHVSVLVSEDDMKTWTEIGKIDKNSNIGEEWKNFSFDLKDYKDKNIVVAVFATTDEANDPEYYNAFIDNIEIREFRENDIAINKIVTPGVLPEYGNDHIISAEIENLGLNAASNFKLKYSIDDKVFSMETYTKTLNPGEKTIYSFALHADLTECTDKTLKVELVFPDDNNAENNSISKSLKTNFIDLSKGSYTNGFEENEDISAWTILNANKDEKEWKINEESRGVYMGERAFSYFSQGSIQSSDDWLISPAVKMFPGTYRISFYYANYAGSLPEKLRIMLGSKPEKEYFLTEIIDMGEISNNEFYQTEPEITILEEGYYYIAWHNYGDPSQMGMSIDNVEIERVSTVDLKANSVVVPRNKMAGSEQLANINDFVFTIENSGQSAITDFKAYVSINNGEAIEKDFTQAISAGSTYRGVLTTDLDLDPYSVYDIKFWVNTLDDGNQYNDTIFREDLYLAAFKTSFETEDLTGNWIAQSIKGSEQTFELINSNYKAHIGDYSYKLKTDDYNQSENDDWLISEGFYLEKDKCYELVYWYNSQFTEDSVVVALASLQNAESMTTILHDYGVLGNKKGDKYYKESLHIAVSETGDYYIGWHVFGDMETMTRYKFFIDDVSLTEVSNYEPVVDFTYNVLDKEVSFVSSLERTENVIWNFGDNSNSNDPKPFHKYDDNGEYEVILNAINGCANTEVKKTIQIDCPLNTEFSYSINNNEVVFSSNITAGDLAIWDFGDGEYSFEENPTHTYSSNGDYNVTLKVIGKCGADSQSKEVNYNPTTGINDDNQKIDLSVYPSPVSTTLYVDGIENINLKQINIYNSVGFKVQGLTNTSNFNNSINLSKLNSGVYFIEFVLNDNTQIVKKIIKK
ncbi:MAG: choice-of-anchor J domain-containing protein [Bacteroidales bacterium]|nr:choice-of-anchor J domain-containing protein [Bacteroidales bacterium]